MNDQNAQIKRDYDLCVSGIKKRRGGSYFEIQKEKYLFSPCNISPKRLVAEHELLEQLAFLGFTNTDRIVTTKTAELYSVNDYQERFILRRFILGEECQDLSSDMIYKGAEVLGVLHTYLQKIKEKEFPPLAPVIEENIEPEKAFQKTEVPMDRIRFTWKDFTEDSYILRMEKHNRELRKVKGFIMSRKKKTAFEVMILESFDKAYMQAMEALSLLKGSSYEARYEKVCQQNILRHGDFTYHNVLFEKDTSFVVHFSKFGVQLQLLDLYDYIRKIMEKTGWDIEVGKRLLESYDKVVGVTKEDLKILVSLFLYPEKYWKQLNSFYNGSKTWILDKNMDKLSRAVSQLMQREQFVLTLDKV